VEMMKLGVGTIGGLCNCIIFFDLINNHQCRGGGVDEKLTWMAHVYSPDNIF